MRTEITSGNFADDIHAEQKKARLMKLAHGKTYFALEVSIGIIPGPSYHYSITTETGGSSVANYRDIEAL